MKRYRAKLIDQISEKSKDMFELFSDKTGILSILPDNRIEFDVDTKESPIYPDNYKSFKTTELQAEPVFRGNEIIFVTLNSTYVFEILEVETFIKNRKKENLIRSIWVKPGSIVLLEPDEYVSYQ
jgi:hypothetical protein